MNQGISEGPETSVLELSTGIIQFCRDYFCLDITYLKSCFEKGENRSHKYSHSSSRSGISLPRAFRTLSLICRNRFGSLASYLCVCVYWSVVVLGDLSVMAVGQFLVNLSDLGSGERAASQNSNRILSFFHKMTLRSPKSHYIVRSQGPLVKSMRRVLGQHGNQGCLAALQFMWTPCLVNRCTTRPTCGCDAQKMKSF